VTQQSKLFRLLAAPSPLPDYTDSDVNLSRYAEKLLKQYIGRALEESLVPPTTLLAHYLHIPPLPSETPFEVPVIVRNDAASRVLGSFMEFRNPNRHKHLSLTEMVTRTDQSGVIVVMSSDQRRVRTSLCRHVHIQIKDLDAVPVPVVPATFLSGIKADGFGSNSEWSLYSQIDVDHIFSHYEKTKIEPPSYRVSYKASTEDERFFRNLFFVGTDNYTDEYISRVAPVVKVAKVVFCIPKLFSDPSHPGEGASAEIGAGACVFYIGEEPGIKTLETLYLITHKLCTVASGVYDIARVISEKKKRRDHIEIIGTIRHSLVNTISKGITSDTKPDTVRRHLALELVTVSAALASGGDQSVINEVPWSTGGLDDESVGETIEKALSNRHFNLKIDDAGVRGHKVDPRLVVILIELARNLKKCHTTGGPEALISIIRNETSSRDVNVELSTKSKSSDAIGIFKRLNNFSQCRGVNWVAVMASKMFSTTESYVSWSFSYDGNDGDDVILKKTGMSRCYVEGPARIFSGDADHKPGGVLTMNFKAHALAAIL
jgi:hypothetical protein